LSLVAAGSIAEIRRCHQFDREAKRLLRITASRQASAQAKNSLEPKVRSRVRQA